MTNPGLHLTLPSRDADRLVESTLAERFVTRTARTRRTRRTFYDTFDWRLYRRGWTLSDDVRGSVRTVSLAQRGAARASIRTEAENPPSTARSLPSGTVARRVAPILGVRAALPLAELDARTKIVEVLDATDKVTCRVAIEELAVEGRRLRRARIESLRGYESTAVEVCRALAEIGVDEPAGDAFDDAVALAGVEPGDYSSKFSLPLPAATSAHAASRAILLALLDTVERNLPGVLDDTDSEFLHDFRVAVRRTRSLLGQVRPLFGADALEPYRRELAWLGKTTGPTRDLDVHLIDLQRLRDEAGADTVSLNALERLLVRRRRAARRAMVKDLRSKRLRRLLADWRAFLEGASPAPSAATVSARSFASRRIRRLHRRVLARGAAMDRNSSDAELHELRKACKKLRYLIELFAGVYEPEAVTVCVKSLKRFQDNLGEFQDMSVQSAVLKELAVELGSARKPRPQTLVTSGRLIERLIERRQRCRAEFRDRFAKFSSKDSRDQFRRQFGKESVA